MKVECKLRDLSTADWGKCEDRLIVKRHGNWRGCVEVSIEDKKVVVDAAELIDAAKACVKY